MDEEEKSFLDRITSPLTGDYRKKKPLSVKGADAAISMTPVGSAVDIAEELGEEDPSYAKIGLIAAGDVLGAAIPAMGPVAKTLIKGGVTKLDEVVDVKDLTKNADSNAIEEIGLTDKQLESWKADNYAKDKFRIPPKPELMEAAEKLRDGKLSQEEYKTLSNQLQPIITIEEMPKFPSKEDVIQALHATDKRKVEKGIVGVNKTIPDGTPISARLDIPAYNDTDTWIVSLHDGSEKSGATVGYAQTAVLDDVKFTTNPLAASSIAAGKPKTTIARMNGSYVNAEPDEVYDYTKEILEGKAEGWTQIGMNPTRASYFYDKSDGMPIVSAEQVLQVGPLVMAYKIKKTTPDDEMFQFTNKRTGVTGNFNEGGMALEEQMAMNFGDVPDNTIGIDPVSGNEIPMGSTAENVRDDIPANLSEGEIVVPADVVNYWGVKLFEDLRAQAKMGYAQMADDGRMGGEPMEDATSGIGIEISLEDLDVVDDDGTEDAFLGKFFAGIRDANKKAREERDKEKVRNIFKNAANKDKDNKTKNQTNVEKMMAAFRDDSDQKKPKRPTLKEKPPTSDDAAGPSIAEQINFGGDYGNTTPKKKAGNVSGAYKARQTQPNNETQNVRYYDKGFVERLLEGLGFDEGGLVEGDLEVEEDVEVEEKQPRKVYEKKGGFDMRQATRVPNVQIYTFENAEGHRIHITYIDGIPQSEVPPGYVQVGDPVNVNTVDDSDDTTMPPEGTDEETGTTATPETGTSGGGGSSSNDSSSDAPSPENFNYKELTIAELKDLVDEMSSMGTALVKLNPLSRLAVGFSHSQTRKEIERRLNDPNVSEVDKMRLQQLLELANRDQPGAIKRVFDKVTGNTLTTAAGQIPDPKIPDVDYNDPTEAYTPDPQTSSSYKPPSPTKTPAQIIQDEIAIKRIEDEMKSQPRPRDDDTFDAMGGYDGSTYDEVPQVETGSDNEPSYTVNKPTVRENSLKEADAQRRRDRQESSKNITGSTARKTDLARSATRGLSTTEKKGGGGLDSRFGITGIAKGGIASKKNKKKKSK